MMLEAVIRIHGPRQLQRAFRKRLMETIAAEASEARVTERAGEVLPTFDFSSPTGIPFPALVAISAQYPECVAAVDWHRASASGETTIQNGQVKGASRESALGGRIPQWIELTSEGVLQIALAVDIGHDGILGYCATADAETWFKVPGPTESRLLLTVGGDASAWDERWVEGRCEIISPPLALAPAERRILEALTASFRAEWLWYGGAPQEHIIVEQQRFMAACRPIHAINVKSAMLAEHGSSKPISSLATEQAWIPELVGATWGQPIPS